MTFRTLAAALLAALLAAGCVGTVRPGMATTEAADFVPMANVSNTFEIDSSRLALARSRDRTVRAFAREMIRDHGVVASRFSAAVRRAGMQPMPPALDERHRDMIAELHAVPAARFDETYLSMQVAAHREAIDLFAAYARDGDDPALRAFADRNLPALREHAVHLTRILGEATAEAVVAR